MKLFSILLVSTLLLACTATKSQPENKLTQTVAITPTIEQPTPFTLPNTQTFTLDSTDTGNTYNIVVNVPGGYNPQDTSRKYPVIYVLDAQWQYPLFPTIAGAIHYDGDMPEAIIVGISWKETNGNLMALRNVDLTPTPIADAPNSGNAKKFQDFFQHQLFPYIDSHFNTNQHRTVTGGSTSSLFVFYTLISQPDLFDGYIGSSPTLYWDNHVIDRILDQAPKNLIKKKTRAYLGWGSLENTIEHQEFGKRLQAKFSQNLEIEYLPVLNAGHAGVNAECYTRGMQLVYRKPSISVSKEALKKLTGNYHNITYDYDVAFSVEKGALVLTYPDGEKVVLTAENEFNFYARGTGIEITFKKDANENYSKITQLIHGNASEFIRK